MVLTFRAAGVTWVDGEEVKEVWKPGQQAGSNFTTEQLAEDWGNIMRGRSGRECSSQ